MNCVTIDLLFCTLISENQGFEKLRSASDLKKISGPRSRLRKKSRFAGPEIFLWFEADFDFSE